MRMIACALLRRRRGDRARFEECVVIEGVLHDRSRAKYTEVGKGGLLEG
jgi:hypothetical protein